VGTNPHVRQRGFSLVEVVVAMGCAVLLGTTLLGIGHAFVDWTARTSHTADAQSSLDALADRWYADAATAWAVFTPANDVLGKSNADGHEFDTVTQDDRRRTSYRAYCYDASTKQLASYAYGSPGDPPEPTGDVFDNISAFDARTYPLSSLRDANSRIYDPLFASATVVDADVHLQNLDPDAVAGNRITRVHIASDRLDRVVMLTSGTSPSHFTIVLKYTPAP
jgi:type II secretory pathway pseudopilin PulG